MQPNIHMTPDERWLDAMWPFVRDHLPARPARIVDLGCGPLGGFVPMLRASGYEAVGVDPGAPHGADYRRIEFEHAQLPRPVDAVVASTSLHHVTDADAVIDQISDTLAPSGTVVIVEWDWQTFDEPTARWCFERLASTEQPGWLHRHRDEWAGSGQEWDAYLRAWTHREGLHAGQLLLRSLDRRFERLLVAHGPYFFPDLAGTSEADERAAIDAGRIRATRIDYVGKLRRA
ncbi:MAG TPA: methyltransferase domain-containing protein [Jatrophihabitans sp.]|nr:methyltransferase domain-containing protein [Jatrophihabitans sp.]